MRLILVWQASPTGDYSWVPEAETDDVLVAFDIVAATDLPTRKPVLFDDLLSWTHRSDDERFISECLTKLCSSPALLNQEYEGYQLIRFVEYPLRAELASVLRGWRAAGAFPGCTELMVGPGTPAALEIGARAALGLDPCAVDYQPTVPQSGPPGFRRSVVRALMRSLAVVSQPKKVRVAAIMGGKVTPAIESLSSRSLKSAGVGTFPFPGLDYGNSARLAVRLRLPILLTLDPARTPTLVRPPLVDATPLADDELLDAALMLVADSLMEASWSEFVATVMATRGFKKAARLRTLVLPTSAVGASYVLLEWARRAGVTVAVFQHGVYGFKEFDGGDSRADVLFAWSQLVEDQASAWSPPRPQVIGVGAPGIVRKIRVSPRLPVRRVLVVSTGRQLGSALSQVAFHELFIGAIAPGLRRLTAAGVNVQLRTHPAENDDVYRRILASSDLQVQIAARVTVQAAVANSDVLVCAPSSFAFEAAALGAPVLLWQGGMPARVRAEFLVRPFSEELPGTFATAGDFDQMAEGLIDPGVPTLSLADDLSTRLSSYVRPFASGRFAERLIELS